MNALTDTRILIQELRGYMNGTQRIEGFNKQEIQKISEYMYRIKHLF